MLPFKNFPVPENLFSADCQAKEKSKPRKRATIRLIKIYIGIFSFSLKMYISESGSGIYLIMNESTNPRIGASRRVSKTY